MLSNCDRGWLQSSPLRTGRPSRSAIHIRPRRYRKNAASGAPSRELTIIHFNDVYNIEERHIEPVGGAARFTHAVKGYRQQQPLILFSGDVFNPSLISSFTRGKQMVPVLNEIGVHASMVGNHDFDFGLEVLQHHLSECRFPWLLSNVLDTRTGEPLGGARRSHVLTWQGVRIGLLGLAERDWLLTIPSLDESHMQYLDFVEEGKRLAKQLWEEQVVDFVIALTHMRTHNDLVLAARVPAIQLVLGGHDHHFEVTQTQPYGTMLVKSGTDFREFSVLKVGVPAVARPLLTNKNGSSSSSSVQEAGSAAAATRCHSMMASAACEAADPQVPWWEGVPRPSVSWQRVEITAEIPEDPTVAAIVQQYMELIDTKMDEPLGWANVDLDARYDVVRSGESNIGNMFADILRIALQADAAFFNGGTIRSDQIHRAGQLCMRDFIGMLPFTDELVLLELSGEMVRQVLETGVGSYPKLEGRFLQVSGIRFQFDPSQRPGSRVVPGSVWVAGAPLDLDRTYKVATKAYLRGGKDGFQCLKSAPILMDGETAPRLATLVQYLLTRIQELNDLVTKDYHTPHCPPHRSTSSGSNGGSPAAAAVDGGSTNGRSLANGRTVAAGTVSPSKQQQQEEWEAVPAALQSTVSSSSTLESEVFLADGAACSMSTSVLVTASLDEQHVVEHLHGEGHHHSALDSLYCWDPLVGKFGLAPRIEGRIVKVGGGGEGNNGAGGN